MTTLTHCGSNSKIEAMDKQRVAFYPQVFDRATLDAMQNELLQKHDLEAAEQRGITISEQRGIAIGEQRGITIGGDRRTLEIARNLKQAGSDIAFIAQITGLSESTIVGL